MPQLSSLFYAILNVMHKDFYASGFLYHPSSEQILLQQNSALSPTSSPWVLFGGIYLADDSPEVLFKDTIFKLLDIKIRVVLPVYSYCNEKNDKDQYIGYATVRSRHNFSSRNGLTFSWFSFKDVLKLPMTKQMQHDIVVGQRVIEAASRKSRGEHTFQ